MKDEMKDWGSNEFLKEGLSDWDPSLDRREFLKLSSAAIALAGLSACVKPPIEKMFSYVSQPEDLVPGESQFFATHFVMGGIANGLLVETHEGRPTRIDGNPSHPANLGAASAIHQALALSLYDPDRIRGVYHQKIPSTLSAFQSALKSKLEPYAKNQGDGFAILSGVSGSDTLHAQRDELLRKYPKMMWVEYDPMVNGNRDDAAQKIFGQSLRPIYDFKNASNVVSIDSDFISHPHSPLVYAKDFAGNPSAKLFAIESASTLTGAKAKHRLALKPSDLNEFVQALASELLDHHSEKTNFSIDTGDFLQNLIYTVEHARGPSIFIASDQQSREMHGLCHLLNLRYGKGSVRWQKIEGRASHFGLNGIEALSEKMSAGKIDTLVVLGGNPAYAAPGNTGFAAALAKVPTTVHLSNDENETSANATWVIPEAHPLETWSDARAFDGTLSFSQPMIAPLYDGISAIELMQILLSGDMKTGREILASHYQKKWGARFDDSFKKALRLGWVENSANWVASPQTKLQAQAFRLPTLRGDDAHLEVSFREDRRIYDGRFANHPWLQELPDPLTRLTWGNAILLHPEDLKSKGFKDGDLIELFSSHQKASGPVFSDPLQARNSASVYFGYGRNQVGSTGKGMGFNVYPLWDGTHFQPLSFAKTSDHEELACTQGHHSMEGRDLVRKVAGAEKASRIARAASLYDKNPIADGDYSWAMTIDLDRCTGCGACVMACQSENNIPVVGKPAVKLGREMHWIRVDRYFENAGEIAGNGTVTHFQPVPCMHCEKAPCEPVCPTGATLHGNGGLNQMVYNRCVGTRYCSNNCPYKVRRFNFLTYNDKTSKLAARARNPYVSVRTRGVMEKCTYCVQRISEARIESARTRTPIADGRVKTACQTTCPSQAIEFGNIKDPSSRVSLLRQSNRNYGLLEELGTRPRTTYLAKVMAIPAKEDA